jgi:hypothetical protein
MPLPAQWLAHPALQLPGRLFRHPTVNRVRVTCRRQLHTLRFDRAMRRALDPKRPAPDADLIDQLITGWGDPTQSPEDPFLWESIDAVSRSRGPVLTLGTGVLTLILGIFAQRGSKQLWALDHNRQWAGRIRAELREHGITAAHLITAPLAIGRNHIWYRIDAARLPANFAVALCDADAVSPTGHVGMLLHLERNLDQRAVILARNLKRQSDARQMFAWAKQRGATCLVRESDSPFVKVVLASKVAQADAGAARLRQT